MNYVFLSRALEAAPPGVLTLIDTHDRFADRQRQYRPFRAEPNFFYTDRAGEAAGLARADIVLAIQSEEAAYFRTITDRRVHLLPPRFPARRPFTAPTRVRRIGFLGHGNDPNLFSIRRFAAAWSEGWTPARPELVIAGEISDSLGPTAGPGIRLRRLPAGTRGLLRRRRPRGGAHPHGQRPEDEGRRGPVLRQARHRHRPRLRGLRPRRPGPSPGHRRGGEGAGAGPRLGRGRTRRAHPSLRGSVCRLQRACRGGGNRFAGNALCFRRGNHRRPMRRPPARRPPTRTGSSPPWRADA